MLVIVMVRDPLIELVRVSDEACTSLGGGLSDYRISLRRPLLDSTSKTRGKGKMEFWVSIGFCFVKVPYLVLSLSHTPIQFERYIPLSLSVPFPSR